MNKNFSDYQNTGLCLKYIQNKDCFLCQKNWWMLRNDGVLFNEQIYLTDAWVNVDVVADFAERLYYMTLSNEVKNIALLLIRNWLETFQQSGAIIKPAVDYINCNFLPYHVTKKFIFEHIKELMNMNANKFSFKELVAELDKLIKEEFVFITRNDEQFIISIYSQKNSWFEIVRDFIYKVSQLNSNSNIIIKYLDM